MAVNSLKRSVSASPNLPGVYKFLNDKGQALYIGKAKSLITRLRSHISNEGDLRHRILLEKAVTVEWIVTRTELEALLLEAELIRTVKPQLNVDLRSSNRYPWLQVTTNEEYPRLFITRAPDRSVDIPRFGPYPDAHNLRALVDFLLELYPLRKCKTAYLKKRERPCLMGQLDSCPAPCSKQVKREYMEHVKKIIYLLRGHWSEAKQEISSQMLEASITLNFEKAADLRDLLKRLDSFGWPTPELLRDTISRDVMAVKGNWGIVIQVRNGRFMGSLRLPFSSKWKLSSEAERISILFRSYYNETEDVPKQVLFAIPPENLSLLTEWILNKTKTKTSVTLLVPERGALKSLTDIANKDLKHFLKKLEWKNPSGRAERIEASLEAIADILHLPSSPAWMVCLDASTIQGHASVAALISFRKGKADKEGYRRFSMAKNIAQNDPAMIANAVARFAVHLQNEQHPDVLLIDGGITQLRAAYQAGRLILPNTKFISIAKKEEIILTAPEENQINLDNDSPPVLLLRAMRDEAHRFVISFHRTRRAKSYFHSVLDDIPGIGPSLKAALLKKFGSVVRIEAASVEEVALIPGIGQKKAMFIKKALE